MIRCDDCHDDWGWHTPDSKSNADVSWECPGLMYASSSCGYYSSVIRVGTLVVGGPACNALLHLDTVDSHSTVDASTIDHLLATPDHANIGWFTSPPIRDSDDHCDWAWGSHPDSIEDLLGLTRWILLEAALVSDVSVDA